MKRKSFLVYCWRGCNPIKNFGEWYCDILLNWLGYDIRYYGKHRREFDEPVLLVIGSNFHTKMMDRLLADSREVWVWGQGNGWGPDYAVDMLNHPQRNRIKVFGVRGPLTASMSNLQGMPTCDPAFLAPHAVPIEGRTGEVLYVPHHLDQQDALARAKCLGCNDWLNVYMARDKLLDNLQRIVKASFVITSSLHVMITRLAYRKPAAYHLSSGTIAEPYRWVDLFDSMGSTPPPSVGSMEEAYRWWETTGKGLPLPNSLELLKAFPHHLARR